MHQIKFKKLSENAVLPTKNPDNAGYDLTLIEDIELLPFTPTLIKLGFATSFPNTIEGCVRPRSSSLLKRRILIHDGTIDSSYDGEWGIIAMYIPEMLIKHIYTPLAEEGVFGPGSTFHSSPPYYPEDNGTTYVQADFECDRLSLLKGERIAQVVFNELPLVEFQEVDSLPETIRKGQGFGSSGK